MNKEQLVAWIECHIDDLDIDITDLNFQVVALEAKRRVFKEVLDKVKGE